MATCAFALLEVGNIEGSLGLPGETTFWPLGLRGRRGV
jgi:hypothetical protein